MTTWESDRLGRGPHGLVEKFADGEIIGWVAAPEDDLPVEVELRLNDLVVARTWATEESSVNSWGGARGFRFAVRDLWSYSAPGDAIHVTAGGETLVMAGRGMFRRATDQQEHTIEELRSLLDDGHVFDYTGRLQRLKSQDLAWQTSVLDLYERSRDVVAATLGVELFVIYGTLLGQVREGQFLGHDDDFDAAFISRHTSGAEAGQDLQRLAFALVDAGFDVDCRYTALHVRAPHTPGPRIDIFHLYFDEDGSLQFPYGVGSDGTFSRTRWNGPRIELLSNCEVVVPSPSEEIVAHIYGPDWRTPVHGFSWDRARRQEARDGRLTEAMREEVYWANLRGRDQLASGSTFSAALEHTSGLPRTILELGCGDGRDAFAFARAGHTVTGLDRSVIGIEHAERRATDAGLADRLEFHTCDVEDTDAVRSQILAARSGDEPLLVYMRSFLDAITEETQAHVLATIADHARPGDHLAVEFRTDEDARRSTVPAGHVRRYQGAEAFRESLRSLGYTITEEAEGTGLSPCGDDDPELYRAVAVFAH